MHVADIDDANGVIYMYMDVDWEDFLVLVALSLLREQFAADEEQSLDFGPSTVAATTGFRAPFACALPSMDDNIEAVLS